LGAIFNVTANGALTTMVTFNGSNGGYPKAPLAQGNGGVFYGTTRSRGANNYGTVFQMTASGVLTMLDSFNGGNGSSPFARLVQGSDSNFYGTTTGGGANSRGTVFRFKLPCEPAVLDIQKYAGLTITGTVGCMYAIEWRPDNGNNAPWPLLTTLTLSCSPYVYIDPTSYTSNPGNRFYRAVLVP
jgi:uncharacterized repeat protein (TIGR03803 family)